MKRLVRGDYVRIRMREQDYWVEAFVALASGTNPSSVMLLFNDLLRTARGVVAGGLPLSIDYEKETITGLDGAEYEIEVKDVAR